MFWNRRRLFKVLLLTVLLLAGAIPVMAHDANLEIELDGVFAPYEVLHDDDNPFKGMIDLTVRNRSTDTAWGDFHFEISQVPVGAELGSVYFTVTDPDNPLNNWAPTSSQAGFTWEIANGGRSLDFWFYGDPVLPGESANFIVYTDNTDEELSFFGVRFNASPVPIPGALILFGSGLLGLLGLRRRRADA